MEALGLMGQQGGALNYYDGPTKQGGMQMTMATRLAMAVAEAEKRLADAKRAKEIFEKNPDLEELLNIMQRTSF